MTKLLAIADDLTGAVDTGVQLAKVGISTFVTTGPRVPVRDLFQQSDVVVINSETRHVDPGTAANLISDLAAAGQQAGANLFYKKTDSTLRGNVGSELDALRRAAGHGRLAFAPALPQLGRVTINGFHFVHGRPLHETGFASDPLNPIRESFIPHILGTQTQTRISIVPTSELQSADPARFRGEAIYVFDAESEAHLRAIAALAQRVGLLGALAGPAGLIAFLPEVVAFRKTASPPALAREPILLVNGSVNAISLRQCVLAAETGFKRFLLPPAILIPLEGASSEEANRLLAEIAQAPPESDLLLQSALTRDDLQQYLDWGAAHGLDRAELHLRVAANTGRFVGRLLAARPIRSLMVFGGDTLVAIAREMHWLGFHPRAELLPGVTYSETASGLRVISKAGGFGDDDLVSQVNQILRNA